MGTEHITVEQFIYVFNVGGEIGFNYDGHKYFASDYGPALAWEYYRDDSLREFSDVDELLDDFHLHTGETLRAAMSKIELDFAPVWPE